MKRLYYIFKRDVTSSVREFLFLYIILAPLIIAVGLRFFIPSVNSVSLKFALDRNADSRIIEEFKRYGSVELLDGRTDIESRVNKVDDIVGITGAPGGKYSVILQGNEKESSKYAAQQIINRIEGGKSDLPVTFSDIGSKMSSVAVYGGASVIMMAIVLSGMVIGLNIIEEKEARTISALSVTPMRRIEFILGKSLVGFILPVIEAFIILWILNMLNLNLWMILVMTLSSSLVAIIFGFLMGVLSSNQISGIANMKFLLMFVSASFIGAVVLPPDKHIFLYWSPLYWSTIGLTRIITNSATWGQVWQYTVWIAALTVGVFALCKGKIRKGLS